VERGEKNNMYNREGGREATDEEADTGVGIKYRGRGWSQDRWIWREKR